MAFRSFGVDELAFPEDLGRQSALIRGLGPAMGLQHRMPTFWVAAMGRMSSSLGSTARGLNPSIRFGVGARDERRLEGAHVPTMQSALRSGTGGVRLTETSNSRRWLDAIALGRDGLVTIDFTLPIAPLPHDIRDGLWAHTFLDEIARSSASVTVHGVA